MQHFKFDLLKLSIDDTISEQIKITWEGECVTKTPEDEIGKLLFNLIGKENLLDKNVILDFKKLTFINSATIAVIVLFLKELKLKDIKVTIDYNKNYSWQAASFKILENFTTAIENIKQENEKRL